MIGKIFTRIFFGKEVTQEVDVVGAKAIITDEDGQVSTITRRGYAGWHVTGKLYTVPGIELLHAYMSEGKRQLLITDEGMVPVCRIKKIDIVEFTHKDSVFHYE